MTTNGRIGPSAAMSLKTYESSDYWQVVKLWPFAPVRDRQTRCTKRAMMLKKSILGRRIRPECSIRRALKRTTFGFGDGITSSSIGTTCSQKSFSSKEICGSDCELD